MECHINLVETPLDSSCKVMCLGIHCILLEHYRNPVEILFLIPAVKLGGIPVGIHCILVEYQKSGGKITEFKLLD